MKKILAFIFIAFLFGCSDEQVCVERIQANFWAGKWEQISHLQSGIHSGKIGEVTIAGKECEIWESYELSYCRQNDCNQKPMYQCIRSVIARNNVCPN